MNTLLSAKTWRVMTLVLAGGISVASCSSSAATSNHIPMVNGNAPWMTTPSHVSASGGGQVIDVKISDITTPEGSEPAYIGPNGKGAADLFTVKAGTTVQVVVENTDAMPHTFTVPQLGLNVTIAPMATAKFSFSAKTAGTYSWYCAVPCGSWVMSHAGYMKGDFKVT